MKVPEISYAKSDDPVWKKTIIRSIEQLSGRSIIERIYKNIPDDAAGKPEFWTHALKGLKIKLHANRDRVLGIPDYGPLIFVANHPFGVLDGVLLAHLASHARQNWGILIHKELVKFDHLEPYFLPVDFAETREAMELNIQTKKRAEALLAEGGALAIFPAGGVATARMVFGKAEDLDWKAFVGKLIQARRSTIIPVFFQGQNSFFFHLFSKMSMTLRLSMILFELTNKIGKKIYVYIGKPIEYSEIEHIKNRKDLLRALRHMIIDAAPAGEIRKLQPLPPEELAPLPERIHGKKGFLSRLKNIFRTP